MFRALIASLIAVLPACTTEGFRAEDGGCPPGEVCSDVTPTGLRFAGSRFSGDWWLVDPSLKMMAEGGTQTVQVLVNVTGEPPFERPFAAELDGSGWSVVASDPPQVVVEADSEGIGYLRIADPDTDELFDKVDIQARRVERAALMPNTREILSTEGPWVLFAGGSRQVYVDLRSPGDERLADEGLALSGGEQVAWDAVAIDRSQPGTATVEAVTGGGARFELTAELVDAIDSIAPADGDSAELEAGTSGFFCFVPTLGEATVHGADWSFRVEGDLTLEEDATALADNCPMVRAGESGSGSVIADAGGRSAAISVAVLPATTARSGRRPAAGSALPLTRGLRASE